jgi:Cu/Ag efflux protein CusF
MNRNSSLLLALLLAASPVALLAAPAAAPAEKSTEVKRHPLRGVITAIIADRSSVMVKHEEIPGVMKAMTMMFKVDPATLKAVKEGDTITGLISRQNNAWVLEDVKRVAPTKG